MQMEIGMSVLKSRSALQQGTGNNRAS